MKRSWVNAGGALLALTLAGSAFAQAPAQAPPSDVAKRAVAKAQGDAILAQAHAEAFFDNLSEAPDQNGAIVLRHKGSGLTCVFNPGQAGSEVILFRPDGQEVGCHSVNMIDNRTAYAARGALTLDQEVAKSVAELKAEFPDAKPFKGKFPPFLIKSLTKLPASRTEGFLGATYESVSVTVIDGWVLKLRISGNAGAAGVLADNGDIIAWLPYLALADSYHRASPRRAKPSAQAGQPGS
jgi:hypothetical protein